MPISVLFDMDGVLVDSEPVINAAAIAGLAEFGVHSRPEDFIPFIGTGEDRYIGGVAAQYGVAYRTEMKDRVYRIYLDIVESQIKTFAGVHGLLAALTAKNIRFALASSADRIKIDANLKAAHIDPALFGAIVSGEDVKNKKPSPDIYLLAAKKLGVEPVDCFVVEDALNGIQAAKAAGMRCVAVSTSFSAAALEKEHPDHICTDLVEVRRVLAGE